MPDCEVPECKKIDRLWDCVNKKVPRWLFIWIMAIVFALIGSLYTAMVLGKEKITDNKQDIAVNNERFVQVKEKLEELKKGQIKAKELAEIVKQAIKDAKEDRDHE